MDDALLLLKLALKRAKAYTDEIAKALAGGLKYLGSVANKEALPLTGNKLGYMYTTNNNGHEWVWIIEAASGTLDDWLDLSLDLDKIYEAVNKKYTKPETGIPKTDLENSVQTSLTKADSDPTFAQMTLAIDNAVTETHEWVEGKGYLTEHQDISGKLDKLIAGDNITINEDGKTINAPNNAYNYINLIADYLFEVQYSTENIDYTYANKYFKDLPPTNENGGGCTGVYKDGRVLRQLDWYYNNEVEFVVRRQADPENNIHASIGIAAGIKGLTKTIVESGAYNKKFKMVPFLLTDGINDAGLYIQSNVVPALSNSYDINPDITAEDKQCCTTMLNRAILDNCSSFAEVKSFLDTHHIYGTSAIEFGSHFLIAKGDEWEVLELTHDGYTIVTEGTGTNQMPNGIISNFRTTGLAFNGNSVDWNSIEEYGLGVERFDIATTAFTSDVALETLRSDLKYTKLYTETLVGSRWDTDYCGEIGTHGEKLKVTDPSEYFNDVFTENTAKYLARTREDGKGTWQTTHSAIYNLSKKSINLQIQERADEEFEFKLVEVVDLSGYVDLTNNQDIYGNKTFHSPLVYSTGLNATKLDDKKIVTSGAMSSEVTYNFPSGNGEYTLATETWVEDKNYLTEHQDISGKLDKLIAGNNITIADDGKTISATDTQYTVTIDL